MPDRVPIFGAGVTRQEVASVSRYCDDTDGQVAQAVDNPSPR